MYFEAIGIAMVIVGNIMLVQVELYITGKILILIENTYINNSPIQKLGIDIPANDNIRIM